MKLDRAVAVVAADLSSTAVRANVARAVEEVQIEAVFLHGDISLDHLLELGKVWVVLELVDDFEPAFVHGELYERLLELLEAHAEIVDTGDVYPAVLARLISQLNHDASALRAKEAFRWLYQPILLLKEHASRAVPALSGRLSIHEQILPEAVLVHR